MKEFGTFMTSNSQIFR